MPYGQKKVFLTKLTDISSSDKEGIGTVRIEGDNEYVYCKGIGNTVLGSLVTIDEDYVTASLTRALGAIPRRLGLALAAVIASKWGWYQRKGVGSVYATASCAADVQLYTDTGLDSSGGGVDDTSTSEHAIHALLLTAACGSAAAATACIMDYPWTAPTFD